MTGSFPYIFKTAGESPPKFLEFWLAAAIK